MKRFCLVLTLFVCGVLSAQEVAYPVTETSPVVSITYSEQWKFHAGEGKDSLWASLAYDDSAWLEVVSSRLLKDQGMSLEKGFGWYRKTIQFNDSLQQAIGNSGAVVLRLGCLAACDEVYMNGNLVGKTGRFPHDYMGYFGNERNYIVYKNQLNVSGNNLIAIKFHEGWGKAGGFLEGALLSISSATTDEKLNLSVSVADSDYIFIGPEPIMIGITLQNNNAWEVTGRLFVSLTTDDFQPVRTDSIDIQLEGAKAFHKNITYHHPVPGFYRYSVFFKRESRMVCEKKFNVGYEPEKIESPINANTDFKRFWDNSLKELNKINPKYKLTLVPEGSKQDYEMYLVEMRSFGDEWIKGYYAKPKKSGKHPVIVEYMGYGSSPYFPNQLWDGFAYFVLSIRGQALNQPTNKYGTWITYGADNKDGYYYRGAFLDVVRALDFVCSRAEIDGERIAVRGGSQGGALSFVAAALDKRVKVAATSIPFLSDYPDYFKIGPWPKSDFDTYMKSHPEANWENIYQLLSYFDIKNLAQWIQCPLIMGIGVQDNVCPPHINFAAYNQVKSEKIWMAFPEFGHSVGREFYEATMNLFREKLNVEKP